MNLLPRQLAFSLFPFGKCGTFSVAPRDANSSLKVNPLPASIQSPTEILSKKPESILICLSETVPLQPADKNITAADGVILIQYFPVIVLIVRPSLSTICSILWSLYKHFITVNNHYSIFPFFLNDAGKFVLIVPLSGQTIKLLSTFDNIGTQLRKILGTLFLCILNLFLCILNLTAASSLH